MGTIDLNKKTGFQVYSLAVNSTELYQLRCISWFLLVFGHYQSNYKLCPVISIFTNLINMYIKL